MAPLFQAITNIVWPPHLFMPKNAIRFKFFYAGSTGPWGLGFGWNVLTVPERHEAVIHWMYLKMNVLFVYHLAVNNLLDGEYGTLNFANTEPTIDGWLMPLTNNRIILKAMDKVILALDPPGAPGANQPVTVMVRGYYWPE